MKTTTLRQTPGSIVASILMFGYLSVLAGIQAAPVVSLLGTLKGEAGQLAIAPSGQIMACDLEGGTIYVCDPETGLSSVYYQFKDGTKPASCTFGAEGNLMVADAGNRRILELSSDLKLKVLTADPRILGPHDLNIGPDGTIYFTDFTLDTNFSSTPNEGNAVSQLWQLAPDHTLSSLDSFWILKPGGIKIVDDQLIVANSSASILFNVDPSGNYSVLATPALYHDQNYSSGPDGLAIASDGTIYVALHGEGAVGVYDASGAEIQRIAVPESNVISVALSPDEQTLYVNTQSSDSTFQILYRVTALPTNHLNTRTDVLTWHNDNTRTGTNQDEIILTPETITNNFGLLALLPVDGFVSVQPLFVYQENIPGYGRRNVVYVATENDVIYAFDSDTYQYLWATSLVPVNRDGNAVEQPYIFRTYGNMGITATPVIDRSVGTNGVIYVEAMTEDLGANGGPGTVHQRLYMLDLANGGEYAATDVQARVPGNGPCSGGDGYVYFEPGQAHERAALTLSNGIVYTAWASIEGVAPYTGWMIGYDQYTLQQTAVFNTNPNGQPFSSFLMDGSGSSFWNSGAGPAVDTEGNIYGVTANGPFDENLDSAGFPSNRDFGDSVVKLSPIGGLTVTDYFSPFNSNQLAAGDIDLGSGGIILLPDVTDAAGQTQQLAIAAGKDRNLYMMNRHNLGKFNPSENSIYQELPLIFPSSMHATAAYFNGSVYCCSAGPSSYFNLPQTQMFSFSLTDGLLSTSPTSKAPTKYYYPGSTPSISSNGLTNGLVWSTNSGVPVSSPGVVPYTPEGPVSLHAYDAGNIATEYYNSLDPSRNSQDLFGTSCKFEVPTVANGKVFAPGANPNALAVFGLLNNPVTLQSASLCQIDPSNGACLDIPLGLSLGNQSIIKLLGAPAWYGQGLNYAILLNFTDVVDPSQAIATLVSTAGAHSPQGSSVVIPGITPTKQVEVILANIPQGLIQPLTLQITGLKPVNPSRTALPVHLPITLEPGVQ